MAHLLCARKREPARAHLSLENGGTWSRGHAAQPEDFAPISATLAALDVVHNATLHVAVSASDNQSSGGRIELSPRCVIVAGAMINA